jgi:hypothetical protein
MIKIIKLIVNNDIKFVLKFVYMKFSITPPPIQIAKLTILILIASSFNVAAQFTTLGSGLRITNTSSKFGIGNYNNLANPAATLTVGGEIAITPLSGNRQISALTNTDGFFLACNTGSQNGPTIEMYGKNSSRLGAINYCAYGYNLGNISHQFNVYDPVLVNWNSLVRIYDNGKVAIGSPFMWTTGDYGLYVEKGIMCESLKVALKNANDWNDKVFLPTYTLMPLTELEQYVKANSHLPNIPSAQEVVNNGIDMAKMDAALLLKIEELTLYTIELQKQITELKNKQ